MHHFRVVLTQNTTSRVVLLLRRLKFKVLCYEHRLQALQLDHRLTRQKTRGGGHLINIYKMLSGIENVPSDRIFQLLLTVYYKRRHISKLPVQRSRLAIQKYFSVNVSFCECMYKIGQLIAPSCQLISDRYVHCSNYQCMERLRIELFLPYYTIQTLPMFSRHLNSVSSVWAVRQHLS